MRKSWERILMTHGSEAGVTAMRNSWDEMLMTHGSEAGVIAMRKDKDKMLTIRASEADKIKSSARRPLPQKLIRRFGTRDPFEIAAGLGFIVKIRNDFKKQRGSFAVILGNVFIFINGSLSEEMQRMVCAHELGHALLHRELVTDSPWILEHELFDMKDRTEYEANLFAANLLIDETEMAEMLEEGRDVSETAAYFHVNVNLLLLKLADMNDTVKNKLPFIPKSDFLGKVGDRDGSM